MSRSPAFSTDALEQRLRAAAKALWWTAGGAAARALTKPTEGPQARSFRATAPPAPPGWIRRAYVEAFAKDAADVAAGLYPPLGTVPPPGKALAQLADFLADAREVDARRRRDDPLEAREEAGAEAYPPYYRQNFHFQTGGWFTPESARRYEAQVESLFAGAAAAMRRRGLSLLAKAWKARDHRGLALADLACGSGGFLVDLTRTFPKARTFGLDLSPAYLAEARAHAPAARFVQANIERLPLADASLDAATCVYLFHELPPKVRRQAAAEIARVLKPGGQFVLVDSVQPTDAPELARMLEAFPAYFHEPYFESYAAEDLPSLFEGLTLKDRDQAFLTKALLFEKPR